MLGWIIHPFFCISLDKDLGHCDLGNAFHRIFFSVENIQQKYGMPENRDVVFIFKYNYIVVTSCEVLWR